MLRTRVLHVYGRFLRRLHNIYNIGFLHVYVDLRVHGGGGGVPLSIALVYIK